MPLTPDQPFPKSRNDTIRSQDWNAAVGEVIRLDGAKVDRAGDTISGPLTISGALGGGPDPSALTIEHAAVPLSLRETGQAVDAGGLWRMPLDGGELRFDRNTAAAGDFSTFDTPLRMSRSSIIGFSVPTVTIASGGSGVLRTRHINGKSAVSDDDDVLFLNVGAGKPVEVGMDGAETILRAYGEINVRRFPDRDDVPALPALSLTTRIAGGGSTTWRMYTAAVGGGFGVEPGAFEIWQYEPPAVRFRIRPNGDTSLIPSGGTVGLPNGGTISASGRLHIFGDELLYLLNRSGVIVGAEWGGTGNLTVEGEMIHAGDRTRFSGFDGAGNHWLRGDDQDQEVFLALTKLAGQRSVNFAVPATGPSFAQTSDARLKKRIQRLEGTLDRLTEIRGVSYLPRSVRGFTGQFQEGPAIGVVAQELEAVFPELVSTSGGHGYKGVDYGGLTAVLLEAVKELKSELDALRERLAALEARLSSPEEDGAK